MGRSQGWAATGDLPPITHCRIGPVQFAPWKAEACQRYTRCPHGSTVAVGGRKLLAKQETTT